MRRRELGFVIGQTDWAKMTDDTYADRALNRTKYIQYIAGQSLGKLSMLPFTVQHTVCNVFSCVNQIENQELKTFSNTLPGVYRVFQKKVAP